MEINRKEQELGFPCFIASCRIFKPDDPFFDAGNIERELLAKQVALDLTVDERYQLQKMEDADNIVYCPIAGCGARLNCLEDFEDHYHARHTSSCSACSRVYPTSRLLSIHVFLKRMTPFFKPKLHVVFQCMNV